MLSTQNHFISIQYSISNKILNKKIENSHSLLYLFTNYNSTTNGQRQKTQQKTHRKNQHIAL
jgi:hypothetical protein